MIVMRKNLMSILGLLVVSASIIMVHNLFINSEVRASSDFYPSKIYGVKMLWNNSMTVNDVAVSKNGKYLVAVNNTGVYYFSSDDSKPIWWYVNSTEDFLTARISANGEYVVVGTSQGYIRYFNDSTARVGEQLNATWSSIDLGDAIWKGTLDMSDNGEYVVVSGTGKGVWYYAACTARYGLDQSPTWDDALDVNDVLAVDMSSDGRYVAVGGERYHDTQNGFVAFYKDADIANLTNEPSWIAFNELNHSKCYAVDVAVSDDGYAVVAVTGYFTTLHYWANATNLTGDPKASWRYYDAFACVAMSSDGDEVVAGSLFGQGICFWSDARNLSGAPDREWSSLKGEMMLDVAISDDGEVISATTEVGSASNYKAYFFKRNGEMIEEFDLLQPSPLLSMSGNGNITAVGGPGYDSLYVFKLVVDSTPPTIENVYQIPASDDVHPEDKVMVYANVTDDLSGVKRVLLNYTTDNKTWFTVEMEKQEGNLYNGTIPEFPYCTTVTYIIIAEDNFNNTITTQEMGYEYQYHVIPEFPLNIMLMTLVMLTTTSLYLIKKRLRKAVIHPSSLFNKILEK